MRIPSVKLFVAEDQEIGGNYYGGVLLIYDDSDDTTERVYYFEVDVNGLV